MIDGSILPSVTTEGEGVRPLYNFQKIEFFYWLKRCFEPSRIRGKNFLCLYKIFFFQIPISFLSASDCSKIDLEIWKAFFSEQVFLNGTEHNSNNFYSIQSKSWPYLHNNIPKRSMYGIFDKVILTLFIVKWLHLFMSKIELFTLPAKSFRTLEKLYGID